MKLEPRTVRVVWSVVVILAMIGMAAAVHRGLLLLTPIRIGSSRLTSGMDAAFAHHRVLTLTHIIPGFLFMAMGPLQFNARLRSRMPWLHRWSGRVLVASGFVIGFSALVMGFSIATGGLLETASTTLFASFFLFSLAKGLLHVRRREVALHHVWMVRAFAIGLAVATIRPIVGTFFATSPLTHLTPRDFFGIAFWIGFTMHLLVAEAWISHTTPAPVRRAASLTAWL